MTSGSGTATTNRLGRQGREWFQHPDAWTASARVNRYQGRHDMKWGGEVRSYKGEAARFEPINLVFNSALTANSSDTPDVVNTGNQWATFLLGALDAQTSARLVPLQTPDLRGYAAYFQDDIHLSDNLTLNVGVRWSTARPDRSAESAVAASRSHLADTRDAGDAAEPSRAGAATDVQQGIWLLVQRRVDLRDRGQSECLEQCAGLLPRFGASYRLTDDSVARFGYARYLMPTTNVRDTLGDFVNQYSGFAQTTTTLPLANGVPQQTLSNPYPATIR